MMCTAHIRRRPLCTAHVHRDRSPQRLLGHCLPEQLCAGGASLHVHVLIPGAEHAWRSRTPGQQLTLGLLNMSQPFYTVWCHELSSGADELSDHRPEHWPTLLCLPHRRDTLQQASVRRLGSARGQPRALPVSGDLAFRLGTLLGIGRDAYGFGRRLPRTGCSGREDARRSCRHLPLGTGEPS